MFESFKAMGMMASLLKDPGKLRDAAEDIRREAEAMRIAGEAGGGAVRVTVDGRMRVHEVEFSPALAGALGDDAARARAEQMTREATNDAIERAQHAMVEVLNRYASEFGFPTLPRDLGGFLE